MNADTGAAELHTQAVGDDSPPGNNLSSRPEQLHSVQGDENRGATPEPVEPIAPRPPHPDMPRRWSRSDTYQFAPEPLRDFNDKAIDPWESCWKAVEKYDDDMCKGFKEDSIDTLLVFAGLFSATVTAFTIDAYKWLLPDSGDETSEILYHISQQLANSSTPAASKPSISDFTAANRDIRINICWFLSIITSLSAALLGILCKQWIREYQKDGSTPAQMSLRLRHLRYLGFTRWGIPELLSLLPVLLQLAVTLFFAGILDLLWHTNTTVAAYATVAIGITLSLITLTTILPGLYYLLDTSTRHCIFHRYRMFPFPFKSPQAWVVLWAMSWLKRVGTSALHLSRGDLRCEPTRRWNFVEKAYVHYDAHVFSKPTLLHFTMEWLGDSLVNNVPLATQYLHCLLQSPPDLLYFMSSPCSKHAGQALPPSVNTFFLLRGHIADYPPECVVEICIRALNDFCYDCKDGRVNWYDTPLQSLRWKILQGPIVADDYNRELLIQMSYSLCDLLGSRRLPEIDDHIFWFLVFFVARSSDVAVLTAMGGMAQSLCHRLSRSRPADVAGLSNFIAQSIQRARAPFSAAALRMIVLPIANVLDRHTLDLGIVREPVIQLEWDCFLDFLILHLGLEEATFNSRARREQGDRQRDKNPFTQ